MTDETEAFFAQLGLFTTIFTISNSDKAYAKTKLIPL